MALTLVQIRDLIRSELKVGASEVSDTLLNSYINQIQVEVATRLGPIVEPLLRKRIALSGATSAAAINSGSGDYDDGALTVDGFLGLTPDAHINDEVVIHGEWTATEKVYKDLITDNDATTLTVAGNAKIGGDADASSVTAIIVDTPSAVDPGTAGLTLPSDCMRPLYLSDSTTPSGEKRIKLIQIDDTEIAVENTLYAENMRAAIHVGNTIRLLKGSSASFPATVVLTYVARPVDFSADSDELLVSEGRLPMDFFGVMRSGILRLANMHLDRADRMRIAADDMNSTLASIQSAWGLGQQQQEKEELTS